MNFVYCAIAHDLQIPTDSFLQCRCSFSLCNHSFTANPTLLFHQQSVYHNLAHWLCHSNHHSYLTVCSQLPPFLTKLFRLGLNLFSLEENFANHYFNQIHLYFQQFNSWNLDYFVPKHKSNSATYHAYYYLLHLNTTAASQIEHHAHSLRSCLNTCLGSIRCLYWGYSFPTPLALLIDSPALSD